MTRRGSTAAVAAVVLFASACGGKTWHTTGPVTPTTYHGIDAPIERSVGKLRRLALLPVKVDVTLALFKGAFSKERTRAVAESLAATWGTGSAGYLSAAKGYEVIRLEGHGEDHAALASLAAWAMDAGRDQTPPPELAQATAALARRLSVDGFLVVRGLQRSPNVTSVLALLTASLSWALIPLESRQEYRGVIVEGASGRLVWRANVWQASIEIGDAHERFRIAPARLFENIEHAVPAALTIDTTNEEERHR